MQSSGIFDGNESVRRLRARFSLCAMRQGFSITMHDHCQRHLEIKSRSTAFRDLSVPADMFMLEYGGTD